MTAIDPKKLPRVGRLVPVWDTTQKRLRRLQPIDAREGLASGIYTLEPPGQPKLKGRAKKAEPEAELPPFADDTASAEE